MFVWELREMIEPCIFSKKWISTSSKFNTNCILRHFLNVEVAEQCAGADIFSKKVCIVWLWRNENCEKTDARNWIKLFFHTYNQTFQQVYKQYSRFLEIKKIPNFQKIIKKEQFDSVTSENGHILIKRDTTYQKTLTLIETTPFFAIKNKSVLTNAWRRAENLADRDLNPALLVS